MSLSREKFGLLLGFIGVVAFAGTLPAQRLAVAVLDPLFLSAATAVLAGGAALAVLLLMRRPLPPRALFPSLPLAGFCSLGAYPVFTALAMVTLPAAHGGVVLGIVPLATAATAAILGYERPGAGFWLTGIAGAVIVFIFVLRRSGTETISIGDSSCSAR